MGDVFAIAQVGMAAGEERLKALSHNAAHASVPGYKRQVSAQQVDFANHFVQGQASVAAPMTRTGIDVRPGQLMGTGKPLDLAIEGPEGFFALKDGDATFLTRDGSFQIDANGYLVGEKGMRVQGSEGDIRLSSSDVSIRSNGEIVMKDEVQATLRLFGPVKGAQLMAAPGALIGVAGDVQPIDSGMSKVRAGFLEGSNAGGPQDMLSLMALTRQYESLVRVTQNYDEVLGKAIQKLGDI